VASSKSLPVIFLAYSNERIDPSRHLRNLSQEIDAIEEALQPARNTGICEIYKAPNATSERIFSVFQDAAFRNRIVVFHYGGHADRDKLQFEAPSGESSTVYAQSLAAFLSQQHGLELAFLNGCSTHDQAKGLLQAGVANVVVTSQAIDDQIATNFALRFYKGLAGDGSIAQAFVEAAAAASAPHGDQLRALYWLGAEDKDVAGVPWKLYPENVPDANDWCLRMAVDDPLFGLPPLPPLDLPPSPFLGLERFTRRQARVFFGRGQATRELYDAVTAIDGDPIILLHGQSGVGKSSLLEAGLMPRLEARHRVLYRRWDKDLGLLCTLTRMLEGDRADTIGQLWNTLERPDQPVVAILDQVEEIFTQDPHPHLIEEEFSEFFQALHDLFGDPAHRPKGRLILGFRKEWLAEIEKQCQQYDLSYRSIFLRPIDKRGIHEAVEGPRRLRRQLRDKYHLRIEEGLATSIAERLHSDRDSPIAPTLQILLQRLWEEATHKAKSAPRFDQELFEKIAKGGIALKDFLEQQCEKLESWNKENKGVIDSGLALDLLAFHVTPGGTAAERSPTELTTAYSQHCNIEALTDKCKDLCLLTTSLSEVEERSRNTRLAHDTLAPLVKQRFDESDRPGQRARRILESRARDWANGRTESILSEADLQTVETGKIGMRAWTHSEKQLVEASRTEVDRQRKAALAFVWATRAKQIDNDRHLAICLALEANSIESPPALAEQVLAELAYPPGVKRILTFGHNNRIGCVARNEDRIITGSDDGTIVIWDRNGHFAERFEEHLAAVTAVALSSKTTIAMSGASDRRILLWDTDTGRILQRFEGHTGTIHDVAISSDGNTMISASADRTVIIWDPETGLPLKRLEGHRDAVHGISLSENGSLAVSGSADGIVIVWDIQSGEQKSVFNYGQVILCVALSSDGQHVLFGSANRDVMYWTPSNNIHTSFKEHGGTIWNVKLLNDGTALSSSSDRVVLHWDAKTGNIFHRFSGHDGAVNGLAVARDESAFVSVGDDGRIIGWNLFSGRRIFSAYGHLDRLTHVNISADGTTVISSSIDGSTLLWDVDSGQCLKSIDGREQPFLNSVLSGDGKIVLSLNAERKLVRWSTKTSAQAQPFGMVTEHSDKIVLSVDGETALFVSSEGHVDAWCVVTGTLIARFSHEGQQVLDIALSADGGTAVCGMQNGTIEIWEVKKGDNHRKREEGQAVHSVAISARGLQCAYLTHDGKLTFWDLVSDETFSVDNLALGGNLLSHSAHLAMSGDSRIIILASDSDLAVWEIQTGQVTWLSDYSGNYVSHALSFDGKTAVSCTVDRQLLVWRSTRGDVIWWKKMPFPVNCIAISRDGCRAALGIRQNGTDALIKTFDLVNENLLSELPTHPLHDVAISGDGSSIIVGTELLPAIAWNNTQREPFFLSGHTERVISVAICPDGRTAVTGSTDHSVILWDLENREFVRRFEGHTGAVGCVAISADGTKIFSGSEDGSVLEWRNDNASIQRKFEGHSKAVLGISISLDEGKLATSSADGIVFVWDLATGQRLSFTGHNGAVTCVDFCADGRVLSGGVDGMLRLWDLEKGQAVRIFSAGAATESVSTGVDTHGMVALSGHEDGSLIHWRVHSREELPAWVISHVFFRRPTCEERETNQLWPACDALGNRPAQVSYPQVPSPFTSEVLEDPPYSSSPRRSMQTILDLNRRIFDALQAGSKRFWYFHEKIGCKIVVSARAEGIDLNLVLELHDPNGNLIAPSKSRNREITVGPIEIELTGYYRVTISGRDSSAGGYTIFLQRVNSK
jgi:WD40 repeat protein